MTDKCGWCGRPIEGDFFWTENTRGTKIHLACLEFLWKLGVAASENMRLREEIVNHFRSMRTYHANDGKETENP